MKCYNCGCALSEKDFCTACGAEVALYKRIMHLSNRYYNEGLDKANIRDLTGAITSLRQSLKFNKHNIEARNLLGLVYFERGQVVAALSEWVISKNFKPKKNIADDYIDAVQNNTTRMDTINQTIKKYNIALDYCKNGSTDLAVIQLKKVLSLNSKFVEAYQLLALLYIQNEEWEKAKRELVKSKAIDTNNITTLLYLKEVNKMLEGDETLGVVKKIKHISEGSIAYQSGNETIIQPIDTKDFSVGNTVLNIIIGIVIGILGCWFLILPAKIANEKADINVQLKTVSDNLDARTAKVAELEQAVSALERDKEELAGEISELTGASNSVQATDLLMQAVQAYLADSTDLTNIDIAFAQIEQEYLQQQASQTFIQLYNNMLELVGKDIAKKLYEDGSLLMNQTDYEGAIDCFKRGVVYDIEDSQMLYQLAQAYRMSENDEKAKETYELVAERFPGTQNATKAEEYLEDL